MKNLFINFMLISICLSASSQQYAWVDYSSNIPDFPMDTVMVGGYQLIAQFTDVYFVNDNEGWVTVLNRFYCF